MRFHQREPLLRGDAIFLVELVQIIEYHRIAAKLDGLLQGGERLVALITLARIHHRQVAIDNRKIRTQSGRRLPESMRPLRLPIEQKIAQIVRSIDRKSTRLNS